MPGRIHDSVWSWNAFKAVFINLFESKMNIVLPFYPPSLKKETTHTKHRKNIFCCCWSFQRKKCSSYLWSCSCKVLTLSLCQAFYQHLLIREIMNLGWKVPFCKGAPQCRSWAATLLHCSRYIHCSLSFWHLVEPLLLGAPFIYFSCWALVEACLASNSNSVRWELWNMPLWNDSQLQTQMRLPEW